MLVDKIKVIFDANVFALAYKKSQTGIYRVAAELFDRFYQNPEILLCCSNIAQAQSKIVTEDTDAFLSDHHYSVERANLRMKRRFLPFRKEKLFRFLYKHVGVSQFKTIFNKQVLQSAQIYYSPYYAIPQSILRIQHLKKVMTIHDLIPIKFPEYNSDAKLLKTAIKSIVADGHAICVSENTKKDLLEFAPKFDAKKIFVVHPAASKKHFYVNLDAKTFEENQKKYNLPPRYFLSLSTLEPRKNIDFVISSFLRMVAANEISDLSLVLAGEKGWNYEKIFEAYELSGLLRNKIIFTGRIDDGDLASVYSNADAFFYMSFYEGFGLPPLEAMQCGVPTVTTNTSSLPEVMGDAGVMLNPTDEKSLVDVMTKLYYDVNYREDLSKKSLNRSRNFSWDKTTHQYAEIFKRVLST